MEQLAKKVNSTLQQKGWMLATAESCTGGWVAKIMTDVAGSSASFDRGFVTYSNAAKRDMLGVKNKTLEEHGAVSEAVVKEMAVGALQNSAADIAVSISGIAGPSGGTKEKPVGTVCFAWASKEGLVQSSTQFLTGNRDIVRQKSVMFALEGVQKLLKL